MTKEVLSIFCAISIGIFGITARTSHVFAQTVPGEEPSKNIFEGVTAPFQSFLESVRRIESNISTGKSKLYQGIQSIRSMSFYGNLENLPKRVGAFTVRDIVHWIGNFLASSLKWAVGILERLLLSF